MILPTGKNTTSRNATATLAFHQFRKSQIEDTDEATERANAIRIGIERVDGKFQAKLQVENLRSLSVLGPKRESKPEATLDGVEIGKAYVAEGATGARKLALRLEVKVWSSLEIEGADEGALEGVVKAHVQASSTTSVVKKLIPPGEGWVRHDDEKLVNPQSQIFFVQIGRKAGQYLKMDAQSRKLEEVGAPHTPQEYTTSVSAGSASMVRKGVKFERAVLLNDITKIARLALKFPLSFVDLPASAFALVQGLRSAESAQWCAENFHKKLLPLLAEKIHTYKTEELQDVLKRTLEALDAELLRSAHAFSGCSALLALVLGDRVVVAGVGCVRAVLLPESGSPRPVLTCSGALDNADEIERVKHASGVVRNGMVYNRGEGIDDAHRILEGRHVFEVMQLEAGEPFDEKQVRSAYRKLALRVHPDKQAEGSDSEVFKQAFARLESAKETLETMVAEDSESCREIHRVLSSEVHTRTGAAALLGVDATASTDTAQVSEDADKARRHLVKRLEKMQQAAPDYERAVAVCREAVETLRRTCTPEALPRQEALLRDGLPTTRAMGARDLRWPCPIVTMQPETASLSIPSKGRYRLALLCGATAALTDEQLLTSTKRLMRQPKASALRWCLDADATAASTSAVCLGLQMAQQRADEGPLAKKARLGTKGPEGTVRVRHILFRHQQLKQPDPLARREGACRTAQDAESAALSALEKLVQDSNQFLRLCRELSDCQTGSNPGMLAGDLGWLAKGQQEQNFEDVAFSLDPNQFGDIVTSSRGIHIIQRLA